MDHTQVVTEAVRVWVVLIVADVITGELKSACNAEAGVRRGVAAVRLHGDIAIREIRIPDPPHIDEVGAGTERLNDVGTDQKRVTKRNRLGRVVVTGAVGRQYVFRGK